MISIVIFVPLNKGSFPNKEVFVVSPFTDENGSAAWIKKNRAALDAHCPGSLGWSYQFLPILSPETELQPKLKELI